VKKVDESKKEKESKKEEKDSTKINEIQKDSVAKEDIFKAESNEDKEILKSIEYAESKTGQKMAPKKDEKQSIYEETENPAESRIDSNTLSKIVDTNDSEDVCDVNDSICLEAYKDRSHKFEQDVKELEKKDKKPAESTNAQVAEDKIPGDKKAVVAKKSEDNQSIEEKKKQITAEQKLTEDEKKKVEADKK